MSGSHGVAFRLTGGTNYATTFFDPGALVVQYLEHLQTHNVKWFVVNLSTNHRGDRYLGPHSILTTLNRGSTPKSIPSANWTNDADIPLESFSDYDLFGAILDGFHDVGVKVIAYVAAEGPSLLKSTETAAYDYDDGSHYVDSCALCPTLTGASGCACAPSVWRWKAHVRGVYGDDEEDTMKRAYAELVVGEYAERYETKLAGFWFDQGDVADVERITDAVRMHIPQAALAFNKGVRLPLRNNNPPYEDYTFGYPYWDLANFPASNCRNFIMIPHQEATADGYYYDGNATKGSLGHVFMPLLSDWNGGTLVWSEEQASEWMSRFMEAKGGWTWSVRRGSGAARSVITIEDLLFLKAVYARLPVSSPFSYQCDWTPSGSPSRAPSETPV